MAVMVAEEGAAPRDTFAAFVFQVQGMMVWLVTTC
jgi:hypothetical protein